jgi:hypothetical protein
VLAVTGGHPVDRRGRPLPEASWPPGREAPEPLERLRRFLNTTNREAGAEALDDPDAARAWLLADGHSCPLLTAADLTMLLTLREGLRDLVERRSAPVLTELAAFAPVQVHLVPSPHVEAMGHGAQLLAGRFLGLAFASMLDGTWSRLKTCGHCRWAYYDRSRNQAGSWCSRAACGSRLKARAYRARQRARTR